MEWMQEIDICKLARRDHSVKIEGLSTYEGELKGSQGHLQFRYPGKNLSEQVTQQCRTNYVTIDTATAYKVL